MGVLGLLTCVILHVGYVGMLFATNGTANEGGAFVALGCCYIGLLFVWWLAFACGDPQ